MFFFFLFCNRIKNKKGRRRCLKRHPPPIFCVQSQMEVAVFMEETRVQMMPSRCARWPHLQEPIFTLWCQLLSFVSTAKSNSFCPSRKNGAGFFWPIVNKEFASVLEGHRKAFGLRHTCNQLLIHFIPSDRLDPSKIIKKKGSHPLPNFFFMPSLIFDRVHRLR